MGEGPLSTLGAAPFKANEIFSIYSLPDKWRRRNRPLPDKWEIAASPLPDKWSLPLPYKCWRSQGYGYT